MINKYKYYGNHNKWKKISSLPDGWTEYDLIQYESYRQDVQDVKKGIKNNNIIFKNSKWIYK